ncbi:hypothetical protein Gohar_003296, partial [Gossypium harknessii]|nr:hypothetical protein [Gossypium harknessii]
MRGKYVNLQNYQPTLGLYIGTRNGEGAYKTIGIVGFSKVMKMESGESSLTKRRGRPSDVTGCHHIQYFDNTDAPYDWLLPGWIVEERFVPSGYRGRGRIYKMMMMMIVMMMVQYYYDPVGHSYRTKRFLTPPCQSHEDVELDQEHGIGWLVRMAAGVEAGRVSDGMGAA